MQNQQMRDELAAEAQRIEEDSTFSAKGHFNAAGLWQKVNLYLGVPATILSATSAVAVKTYPSLAAAAAIIVAVLSGLMTFLKPSDRAGKHKEAAGHYLTLKNQARIFRNIELRNLADEQKATQRIKELASQRDRLNQTSLAIPNWAFQKARQGIEAGESAYAADQAERA